MRIIVTWPAGTTVEFEKDTSAMSSDGVDTLLRQVHDLSCALLAEAIEQGIEGETAADGAEVETELEAGEVGESSPDGP